MSDDPMATPTPVQRLAYMLWQADQGYLRAEDRAIGTNWFTEPLTDLHPDDLVNRPGWISMAEELLAAIRAEGLTACELTPLIMFPRESFCRWWCQATVGGTRHAIALGEEVSMENVERLMAALCCLPMVSGTERPS